MKLVQKLKLDTFFVQALVAIVASHIIDRSVYELVSTPSVTGSYTNVGLGTFAVLLVYALRNDRGPKNTKE